MNGAEGKFKNRTLRQSAKGCGTKIPFKPVCHTPPRIIRNTKAVRMRTRDGLYEKPVGGGGVVAAWECDSVSLERSPIEAAPFELANNERERKQSRTKLQFPQPAPSRVEARHSHHTKWPLVGRPPGRRPLRRATRIRSAGSTNLRQMHTR